MIYYLEAGRTWSLAWFPFDICYFVATLAVATVVVSAHSLAFAFGLYNDLEDVSAWLRCWEMRGREGGREKLSG